jgi:hypothetical protein
MKTLCALTALTSLLLCSFAAPPPRQDPDPDAAAKAKEKKVRRLLDVSGAGDIGKQVMDSMMDAFAKRSDLPKGFVEKFKEMADVDSLVDLIVPIYQKHLTEADVDAIVTFYESEAGRSLAKAQPAIVLESQKAGEKWGMKMALKVLQELQEEGEEKDEGEKK